MTNRPDGNDLAQYLRHLLVIELWRGGLTQGQISKKLHLSKQTVNEMLKGVSRSVFARVEAAE
jgi:DNA-binding transcriptional regulator LsrR (DeoR family)